MLIIRVVQHLFSTFLRESSCRQRSASPAQELPPAAQRGGGRRQILSRAEQCVPAQALELAFARSRSRTQRRQTGLRPAALDAPAARQPDRTSSSADRHLSQSPCSRWWQRFSTRAASSSMTAVGGIGLFVPCCDGATVQQRLDALRPGQRDAQQLTAPFGLLRRGLLLPHFGKRSQRCRRVGQCPGKVIEVEDRIPGRAVGTAPVVRSAKARKSAS